MSVVLECRDDRGRRRDVREREHNGLDYVEVSRDQRRLTVFFLGKAPSELSPGNFAVEGGRRVRGIRVIDVDVTRVDDPELDDSATVAVDRPGDFSTYTLRVVEADERGRPTAEPLHGFDPRYDRLEFSFKIGCPSDLDCKVEEVCDPEERGRPEISYLAKDYASFRRLALDRLALVVPGWQERHAADLGVAVVELLAYVGDYLSYYQDAVATEAYLGTARLRTSVRRHARLVDYVLHEGCNARAWVCVAVTGDVDVPALEPVFVTRLDGLSPGGVRDAEVAARPASTYERFEPLAAPERLRFWRAHNELRFYTWGELECCLPKRATSATLRDEWVDVEPGEPGEPGDEYGQSKPETAYGERDPKDEPQPRPRLLDRLAPEQVLVLVERRGPRTGLEADADPAHRHAVLLTRVEPRVDPVYDQPVVDVQWVAEDALPYPLCISSRAEDCELVEDVSVALGNAVLVEHGDRREHDLGTVEGEEQPGECDCAGRPGEATLVALPFRPALPDGPVTFSEPLSEVRSATAALRQDPRRALPRVRLTSTPAGEAGTSSTWCSAVDLLRSEPGDERFVVEVDDEGRASLRFGDGELGRAPDAGETFVALYRVGNGLRGCVAADAIAHVVFREGTDSSIVAGVRNPLAAVGGRDPEPVADARLLAPGAFRTDIARAVTAADYAAIARRESRLQQAAATLDWTGSWYEARVAVDPLGTEDIDPSLLDAVANALYPFKRIGHDLDVVAACCVPIDLALVVCLRDDAVRGAVRREILDVLSTRRLPGGKLGLFHTDSEMFGSGVAVSVVVSAVQAVPGVESVAVTRFERLGGPPGAALETGFLHLGALEIPRLDNDPSFPENGRLTLDLRGGR